jgi:hypothetical protein
MLLGQLAFLDDGPAVLRYEITSIASERVNSRFRLSGDYVDVDLIGRRRENRDIGCPLFALRVVEGGVDGLGSREIEGCIRLRRVS